jgi:hypothetical protein
VEAEIIDGAELTCCAGTTTVRFRTQAKAGGRRTGVRRGWATGATVQGNLLSI